jgi:hypothetical protein
MNSCRSAAAARRKDDARETIYTSGCAMLTIPITPASQLRRRARQSRLHSVFEPGAAGHGKDIMTSGARTGGGASVYSQS